jgi:peptidoglycan/xylan/chitin deacetylase (PgdA/CDA1 family)
MNKTHAMTSMNKLRPIIVALLIAVTFTGIIVVANSAENKNTVVINLQVDAENTGEHLFKVLGELEGRGYTTTVYVTGSFAENNGNIIQEIQENGHEIAFHGWETGEILETMDYNKQKKILTNSKNMVEIYSEEPVVGFRPQYYSQNEDTFDILDKLNVYYDSGFISRLKYIPGYENYAIPYKVPNHNFYAVPVSSYVTPDNIIYLCDLSASRKFKLSATEWSTILNNKFKESKKNNEPMVVVIHPWITGNETSGYWQAFTQFLNRIENKNIDIVTTGELVKYYVEEEEELENYMDMSGIAISPNQHLSNAILS